jgi:fibro-slime domain-containing protein
MVFMAGALACAAAGETPPPAGGNGTTGGSGNGTGGLGSGTGGGGGISLGTGSTSGKGCDSRLPVIHRDFKDAGLPEVVNNATTKTGIGRRKRVVEGPGCWTAANPMATGVCRIGRCEAWNFDPPTHAIFSAMTFSDWYNTRPGVNVEVPSVLELAETPPGSGTYVYDTNAFFPLDSLGLTPGQSHNFHFTTEISVMFSYQPGQRFTFRGDDDLWIFVNGRLALDVGGQHQALEGTLDFDAQAATLGIAAGGRYRMDIFHAERQTLESNFRIETNISCFEPVVVE